MNTLTILKALRATAILLCACCTALPGQVFQKEKVYEQARGVFDRKINRNVSWLPYLDSLRELPRTPRHSLGSVTPRDGDGNENLSKSPEAESELHAAINPIDSNNIIVSAMRWSEGLLGGDLSFPVYYTHDFGATWQRSDFDGTNDFSLLTLLFGGGDPVIAFDADGVAYLSYLTVTLELLALEFKISLRWAVSRDGGATWTAQPQAIDEGRIIDLDNPRSRFVDKEWMAADLSAASPYRNNLYVAYAEIDLSDTSYQILVKRKDAGKETFEPETARLAPAELVFVQFASIDIDRQGRVHVLFAGARADDEVASLYHCRSDNGGKTFSSPLRIAPASLPCFPPGSTEYCPVVGIDPNRVYHCPHLRVDASGGPHDGYLYAVWTADGLDIPETLGLDIYFSRSIDGGLTWSAPIVLNDDENPAIHQFFPSIFVNDQGLLIAAWYDRREDPANVFTQFYMTYSNDGGASFAPSFAASTEASDFSQIGSLNADFGVGEYTQIVASDHYALPFWPDGRTNDGNIEIYWAKIQLGEALSTDVAPLGAARPAFSLSHPFPNPARGETRMTLYLERSATLALSLIDARGRVARQQALGLLPPGEHLLVLPVEGLAPGVYWAKVETPYGVRARPLLIP
jgi:hypothetical protein